MDKFINDMLTYIETREEKVLIEDVTIITKDMLAVVVTKLLRWLKLEYKRTLWKKEGRKIDHKPLALDMNYPWCRHLKIIMDNVSNFQCFKITDKGLEFADFISEEERERARKIVFEGFNPPMAVDKRRDIYKNI